MSRSQSAVADLLVSFEGNSDELKITQIKHAANKTQTESSYSVPSIARTVSFKKHSHVLTTNI